VLLIVSYLRAATLVLVAILAVRIHYAAAMVKKIGKYELGKTLGEGRFGKVKFGINTETGEQVAIKILVKSKVLEMKAVERVKREIAIMKKISHANVVTLVEVQELKGCLTHHTSRLLLFATLYCLFSPNSPFLLSPCNPSMTSD
tara:strand:+ start:377 stop:811 length:435 start_codon:yes stop_codon:yes gene_type:complete